MIIHIVISLYKVYKKDQRIMESANFLKFSGVMTPFSLYSLNLDPLTGEYCESTNFCPLRSS